MTRTWNFHSIDLWHRFHEKVILVSSSSLGSLLFTISPSTRVRYKVAKGIRGQTFRPDEVFILELPTDGRPYFSSQMPSTYMGSLVILNRSSKPIKTLCANRTTIGRVAYLLHQTAACITPSPTTRFQSRVTARPRSIFDGEYGS
ncbi:hypothetical protein PITC_008830 [Penicillium italicum]|uniref:Uncharacterized protein n=1 Tax=Penicillium italicum TaxID=40296 RepID=A0A0A2L2X4_PENIT|nr:hypothetical protein PITC_008830 [Penicillium italicum]